MLKKNVFPIKLLDSSIKNYLNKRLTGKPVTLTVEKKKGFSYSFTISW